MFETVIAIRLLASQHSMQNTTTSFHPEAWMEQRFQPEGLDTTRFMYDHMSSQSGRCLPVIYEPFNPQLPYHFDDRGAALDFAKAAGGGRVLDFGPGDGWPSLIIAPFCREVVGVDASQRRVEECRSNAQRLGITNVQFVHNPAGQQLPFADGEFDCVVAASSLEQSPDPRAVLKELARVLVPGGTLRMWYEGLARYRGGREREAWVHAEGEAPSYLFYVVRDLAKEQARQWRLAVGLVKQELRTCFEKHGLSVDYAELSGPLLEELAPKVTGCAVCTTIHPSCATWLKWLEEAGFSSARATHSGQQFARRLHDELDADALPATVEEMDALLRPVVNTVVELPAPIEADPMITATK